MPSPRFVVRRSDIHGRGVFARVDLPRGIRLMEYRGERISWARAQRRFERSGVAGHTFFFDLGDGTVIDGGRGGNAARWINHGCAPNCETVIEDGRVWIDTIRPIPAGGELLFDYRLLLDDDADEDDAAEYACRCGARRCRGTMLATD